MNEATTDTMGPMSMGMIIVPPLPPGRALDPPGEAQNSHSPPGRALDSPGGTLDSPFPLGRAQDLSLFLGSGQGSLLQ